MCGFEFVFVCLVIFSCLCFVVSVACLVLLDCWWLCFLVLLFAVGWVWCDFWIYYCVVVLFVYMIWLCCFSYRWCFVLITEVVLVGYVVLILLLFA